MGTVATHKRMWEEFKEFQRAKRKFFPESMEAKNYEIISTPDMRRYCNDGVEWRIKWILVFCYDSLGCIRDGFVYGAVYNTTTQILINDLSLEGKKPGSMILYFNSLEQREAFCELFSDDLEKWRKLALRKCLKMYGITMKQYKEEYENSSGL